jgi:hypothetical protein
MNPKRAQTVASAVTSEAAWSLWGWFATGAMALTAAVIALDSHDWPITADWL